MSDPNADHDLPHEGPIKTPRQLIAAVAASFIVPIVAILMLVNYVVAEKLPGAGSDGWSPEAVAARIAPVGRVEVKDVNDPASLKAGAQVFAAQCAACHTAGVAGAPKLGDLAAWAPRIKTGYDALLASALKGKGAMGPQGGGDFSDVEIGRAVVHMTNQSGAKFDEPKLPATLTAAVASAPGPAASAMPAPTAAAMPTAPAATPGTAVAAVVPAAAPAGVATAGAAPALYTQACAVCHVAGIANAPKVGDKAAWAPRLALGVDGLTASVIKGKGAMPPKGGTAASDAEIKAVVDYMLASVK